MTIEDVLKQDELALRLGRAETLADFRAIFAAEGVSENGINHFLRHLAALPAVPEEASIPAGMPLAKSLLYKWAARVQSGEWA